MSTTPAITVLHVEAGRHFYGGARQVAYLMQGLAARGVRNVLACAQGSDVAHHAPEGAEVIELPMRGDADAPLAWRLARLARRSGAQLLHLHSRRGADVWGGVAARIAGLPSVLSRRVDNPESRVAAAIKYPLFDHVITISEAIRRVLLDAGVAPGGISCVRSAVDASPYLHPVERAALTREFGVGEDELLVGIVAQLIARKGHRHLIDAVDALRARHPRLRVLVFGRGPLEPALRAEVQQRGLSNHFVFAGFRDDLPRWLGGLDLLVHPAQMEGLGVALLQASAAAVPIIASRAGGLPEAVADGVTGLLVPPGDGQALCAAMDTLLCDPARRRRMGDAGRARVLAEFSVETMAEGNLAVYRRVLASRRQRGHER